MSNNQLLFSPFNIKKMQLSNRIVMAPMTRSMSPNNIPDDNVVNYYRRRAQGGVGLIITEGTYISPSAGGENFSDANRVPLIYDSKTFDGWRKVTSAVHDTGNKIFLQLWHVGSARDSNNPPKIGTPSYGPSKIQNPNSTDEQALPIAMNEKQIANTINDYSTAALNAKNLGFDGIEIHAAHGYLIDQFFWSYTNHRDDVYGGDSPVKRTKFACEVIKSIRQSVGADYPISLRFSQWKIGDYKARLFDNEKQLALFLEALVDAGVDIFHCSTRDFNKPEFSDSNLGLAGWTKKLTGKPTIAVGSVGIHADFIDGYIGNFKKGTFNKLEKDIDLLNQRLENNEFDLIALGRALIAEPEWANKIKSMALSDITLFQQDMINSLF